MLAAKIVLHKHKSDKEGREKAMNRYVKPMIVEQDGLAEGVYMASGGTSSSNTSGNGPKCDSVYMKGVWQAPDYSPWGGTTRGYKQQFACL